MLSLLAFVFEFPYSLLRTFRHSRIGTVSSPPQLLWESFPSPSLPAGAAGYVTSSSEVILLD